MFRTTLLLFFMISGLLTAQDVIPKPRLQMYPKGNEVFKLQSGMTISYGDEKLKPVAEQLAARVEAQTHTKLKVAAGTSGDIALQLQPRWKGKFWKSVEKGQARNGYSLLVTSGKITIRGVSYTGVFYGSVTLDQLLQKAGDDWVVRPQTILDAPVYPWRGMMLDVARYFFTKEYVMRYIDMMAMHKLNVLHWHLIDDCGWRIEIKRYPKLTEIGAWRGKGKAKYGGFYSQEDIKEIVAYGQARGVMIVPEIEIPAHTLSALAAYPQLGCQGKQFSVPTRHSISPEIYCVGRETTWKFLEDVMDEVIALFPAKFIHIGGDEAKYDRWKHCPHCQKIIKKNGFKSEHELQGWTTRRIAQYVEKKGKRIIGWEEIPECGIDKNTGVMVWNKPAIAVKAANQGHPVVMAIVRHTYFDTPESRLAGEPPAARWTPPVSLQKAYQWEPTPKGVKPEARKNILGPNGCVWSDQFLHNAKVLADKPGEGTTASEAYIDYLSLPRMAALAEVGWTPQSQRDYGDFMQRMKRQYNRYTAHGYKFRVPLPLIKIKTSRDGKREVVALVGAGSSGSPIHGGVVRYTLDGSKPTLQSPVLDLSAPLVIESQQLFTAATFTADGKRQSLNFRHASKAAKWAKYGVKVGQWKSGQPGNGKPVEMIFDATGKINGNGTYRITFIYTSGAVRLDIDSVKIFRNDEQVAEDMHHGFTGASSSKNSYNVKITSYETGAAFKIKAQVYGDTGKDTNGVVLIKKVSGQ